MLLATNLNQGVNLSPPTLESQLKVLYLRVAAPIVTEGLSDQSVLGGVSPGCSAIALARLRQGTLPRGDGSWMQTSR